MEKHDVISDIFSTLRLQGGLYFRVELQGDFAIALPAEQRRIRFHLVRRGDCQVSIAGGDMLDLSEGDLAIVPNGSAQLLTNDPGRSPVDLAELLCTVRDGVLRYGTGSRQTELLCGFCRFDEAIDHPVLANLPGLLAVRLRDLGGEPWAAATLRLLALEADLSGQGSNGILSRLLEVIFIQAVRRMTPEAQVPANGFMAALADAQLSRALLAIHGQPEVGWKVSELARLAGMSRARFAERFAALVGMPPNGYLVTWRLSRARGLLVSTDLDMAEIAGRCGYASVPSFTRRFKDAFGIGPGAYRREGRRSDGAAEVSLNSPPPH